MINRKEGSGDSLSDDVLTRRAPEGELGERVADRSRLLERRHVRGLAQDDQRA